MDDAMILRCGHSFGSGGVQQIIRMVIPEEANFIFVCEEIQFLCV